MSYTVGRGTGIAEAGHDKSGIEKPGEKLSLGVAARLSRYLQVLTQARKMGKQTISSQELADEVADAGVKIIFNYSDALIHVAPEVTVHTSSPAVDLLYALYFYLT